MTAKVAQIYTTRSQRDVIASNAIKRLAKHQVGLTSTSVAGIIPGSANEDVIFAIAIDIAC